MNCKVKTLTDLKRQKNVNVLFTGFIDNKGKEIYQGDILKISYVEASSVIFEQMKKNGDKYIYLILEADTKYLNIEYKTHDEKKYFTGGGGDLRFLKYLIENKKCAEVVGNVIEDFDFYKKITKRKEEDENDRILRLQNAKNEIIKDFEKIIESSDNSHYIDCLYNSKNNNYEDYNNYYGKQKDKILKFKIVFKGRLGDFIKIKQKIEEIEHFGVYVSNVGRNSTAVSDEFICTLYLFDGFEIEK